MRRILLVLFIMSTLSACSVEQVALYLHKPVSEVTPEEVMYVTAYAEQTALHEQPFLKCTRAHESDSAGGYQALSESGQYKGAYQFDQNTWDNTAAHAGRADLIGAIITQVSPADQDAMAWVLYQWQGNSPWGGRC